MRYWRNAAACYTTVILLAALPLFGQENAGKGLPALIDGNERFGRRLLQQEHAGAPEKNIIVAPLSLTLAFSALHTYSWSTKLREELQNVFHWAPSLRLELPARQLMVVFDPPKPLPCKPGSMRKKLHHPCATIPQDTWITNTFLYRSKLGAEDPISSHFRLGAEKNFGFKFVNVGDRPPDTQDLHKEHNPVSSLPDPSNYSKLGPNDVLSQSGVHLKTAWHGNTFSMSHPRPGEFHSGSGTKKVTLIDSELEQYFYVKTEIYEAVALPGNDAYMIVVLPAPDRNVQQIEQELADHPEALDAGLKREIGIVTIPEFHIAYESDLSGSVQALGIKEPFRDLHGIINIPQSHLTRIAQRVDIKVDKQGIVANAETVAGAIYGGILAGRQPFRMIANRPFVFLIRDQTTNALLFVGAVMDPDLPD